MPSLEILDISRNEIRDFPTSPGAHLSTGMFSSDGLLVILAQAL